MTSGCEGAIGLRRLASEDEVVLVLDIAVVGGVVAEVVVRVVVGVVVGVVVAAGEEGSFLLA